MYSQISDNFAHGYVCLCMWGACDTIAVTWAKPEMALDLQLTASYAVRLLNRQWRTSETNKSTTCQQHSKVLQSCSFIWWCHTTRSKRVSCLLSHSTFKIQLGTECYKISAINEAIFFVPFRPVSLHGTQLHVDVILQAVWTWCMYDVVKCAC